jgi:Vitamin-D-receptor interacting Mediator subunit 4
MNAKLSSALDGLENKLNSLLTSLTTPAAVGAPAATIALLEADDVVSSALDTLRTHQANYAKILLLRTEAQNLEERIKAIVRDVSGAGKEIAEATGDHEDDDYDNSTDDESDTDTDSDNDEVIANKLKKGRRKEVDYKLLLEFARRISKYNKQAAADATLGTLDTTGSTKKIQEKQTEDAKMVDADGLDTTGEQPGDAEEVTVGAVTKEATSWLEESADADRQFFMIPYPNEDRIRMGLMGQLQLAAMDGNVDPEKEAERMVQEAEGTGVAGGIPDAQFPGPSRSLADEAGKAAIHAGSQAVDKAPASAAKVAVPAPQPKSLLDLDLYDPEDDD